MSDTARTLALVAGLLGCLVVVFATSGLPKPWNDVCAYGVFAVGLLLWYRMDGPVERRRDRMKRGKCLHCGYSLTGNVSGVCPECGRRA